MSCAVLSSKPTSLLGIVLVLHTLMCNSQHAFISYSIQMNGVYICGNEYVYSGEEINNEIVYCTIERTLYRYRDRLFMTSEIIYQNDIKPKHILQELFEDGSYSKVITEDYTVIKGSLFDFIYEYCN